MSNVQIGRYRRDKGKEYIVIGVVWLAGGCGVTPAASDEFHAAWRGKGQPMGRI